MCGIPGPDDGIDPRELFKSGRRSKNDRRDRQLCRQVFETLSYVLSSVSHDEVLEDLVVREVVPAPDASRLLVIVCPFAARDRCDPVEALQHLHQAVGGLRAEIARSISRRKVPDLVFCVIVDGVSRGFEQRGRDHE
jgi:ribosome-binding factor A